MMKLKVALVVVWILLWTASLLLPVAIMGPDPDNVFPGWLILLMGWMGPFAGHFGWFANLVFPAVVVLPLIRPTPVIANSIALAVQIPLAINALFWDRMYGDNGSGPIESFGLGYYLWFTAIFGSALVLLIVTVAEIRIRLQSLSTA